MRYYNILHVLFIYFGRHLSSVSVFASALKFETFKSIISNALLLRSYKSKYWKIILLSCFSFRTKEKKR